MTDEEISAINRKLAEWVGICPHEDFNHLTESDFFEGMPVCSACGVRFDEKVAPPDYYNTNAAMDLLEVLVEKGYHVRLQTEDWSSEVLWEIGIWENPEHYALVLVHDEPVIPAAICYACLGVIEWEGGE